MKMFISYQHVARIGFVKKPFFYKDLLPYPHYQQS